MAPILLFKQNLFHIVVEASLIKVEERFETYDEIIRPFKFLHIFYFGFTFFRLTMRQQAN